MKKTNELRVLVHKWRREADEIEADGDICCALTRRHDADELEAVLADEMLSLRDHFAKELLSSGLLNDYLNYEDFAKAAYMVADAMLAERAKALTCDTK